MVVSPELALTERIVVIAEHHTLTRATAPHRHAVAVTRARLGDLAGIDRTHDWVRRCETPTQMWFTPELDEHRTPERALLHVAVATTIDWSAGGPCALRGPPSAPTATSTAAPSTATPTTLTSATAQEEPRAA